MIQIKHSFFNKSEILAIRPISSLQTGTLEDEGGEISNHFYFNNRGYEYTASDSHVVITSTFGCIAISDTEKDMILSQF